MAIIGNQINSTNYLSDQFSGDSSTVAFTLSLAPASAASISVYVSGLYQIPGSAYTVSGSTLTFTGAPPTGTNNIYVLYLGVKNQNLVPVNGSITPQMLNNANVVYWGTGNNNVGIGNTTPTHRLVVQGNTYISAGLLVGTSVSPSSVFTTTLFDSVNAGFVLQNATNWSSMAQNSNDVYLDVGRGGTAGSLNVRHGTGLSSSVTIAANTNVGIGTTSPSQKLEVAGSIKLGDGNADGPQMILASSGYSDWNIDNYNGSLRAYYGSNVAISVAANGNFGINSNAPASLLYLQCAGTTSPSNTTNLGSTGSIFLYNAGTGSSSNATVGVFGHVAGNLGLASGIGFSRENDSNWATQIRFYTHPSATSNINDVTERMRITGDGYVGIGTGNPGSTLHLVGEYRQQSNTSGLPFIMKGGYASAPSTNWQTVHTFATYASTAFFLMVSYEDNNADGNNRSAVFIDSGTTSYGGGFSTTRIGGSTQIECQRSGDSLQVRTNTGGGGGSYLQWQVFLVASTGG